MTTPRVTEIPLQLEPTTRDPFIDSDVAIDRLDRADLQTAFPSVDDQSGD